MTLQDKLKEIEKKYKKNELGAVVKPACKILSVDKDAGIINLGSSEIMEWSQEIEEIHWLIARIKELEAALEDTRGLATHISAFANKVLGDKA